MPKKSTRKYKVTFYVEVVAEELPNGDAAAARFVEEEVTELWDDGRALVGSANGLVTDSYGFEVEAA
jgi:hypothetical protein